ncbi:MAG: hypothetical protein HY694_00320 [Deltaproteobacteria bacterium]|nr:hypothetical protein [Deltaproteobacteria bacterium]
MVSKTHNGKNGNGEPTEESTSTAVISLQSTLPQDLVEQLQQSESLVEIVPEDRLIAHECFNVKLKDKEDEWIPANRFFNTVTEEPSEEIEAVLLFLKKTRRYVVWDEDAGSVLTCHSLDMKLGSWQEPEETRECLTCPFQKWGSGRNGDPPKCKLVWNFVGINLKTSDPFIVSAKSTSLKPMRQFLNRYFIGKLRGRNLPLFCYAVRLRLIQPIGTYAVLQPQIGPVFGREDIETWYRLSQELWNSQRIDLAQMPPEEVEEKEEKVHEEAGAGTPF